MSLHAQAPRVAQVATDGRWLAIDVGIPPPTWVHSDLFIDNRGWCNA